MNINQLRTMYPDEASCEKFFITMIWPDGRICPHCACNKSWPLHTKRRFSYFECAQCTRQFAVTTKTPLHATKLSLWTWVLGIYMVLNSSKGLSSVFLARLIGTSQKTAWKMGHAIRLMMQQNKIRLSKTVEKYLGGKPKPNPQKPNKRGKGTDKQCVFVAIERSGAAYAQLVQAPSQSHLYPLIDKHVDKNSCLMTDKNPVYQAIGKQYNDHQCVNHSRKEFVKGLAHTNTVEAFNLSMERARLGVYHYMSVKHLQRYVGESIFRWNQRYHEIRKRNDGSKKKVVKFIDIGTQFKTLLRNAKGRQLRWTANSSIRNPKLVQLAPEF